MRYVLPVTQVPILVAFEVEVPAVANSTAFSGEAGSDYGAAAPAGATAPAKMGCIFKVGDDIRQDVLAIQVRVCARPCMCVCWVNQRARLCWVTQRARLCWVAVRCRDIVLSLRRLVACGRRLSTDYSGYCEH